MTMRDRLAADLDAYFGENDSRNVNPDAIADRLIALGWVRLDEERLAEHEPHVAGWPGESDLYVECACGWESGRFSPGTRWAEHIIAALREEP